MKETDYTEYQIARNRETIANDELSTIVYKKKNDYNRRVGEKVAPLQEQIRQITMAVQREVDAEFEAAIRSKTEEIKKLEKDVELARTKEAANHWHPEGTIVNEVELRHYKLGYRATGRKAVVVVYDGSYDLSANLGNPPVGSKIVIFLKKDGSRSLLYKTIWMGYEISYDAKALWTDEELENYFKQKNQSK